MRLLRRKLRRDIRRQRAQFGAVAVTVFLGAFMFGLSLDAFRNLEASYDESFVRYKFANYTIDGGATEKIRAEVDGTAGVEATRARVQADLPFRVGKDKLLGRVVGFPVTHQPAVNGLDVVEGEYLDPTKPNGVVVDQNMADAFDIGVGDSLDVVGPSGPLRVEILGVGASPEYFWPARSRQDLIPSPKDFGVLYASERFAEKAAVLDGPNQVVAYYDGGQDSSELDDELGVAADRGGAAGSFTRAEQPSNSALEEDLKGFQEMAVMFPLLFLGAAGLATSVLLTRLVTAQRPIVGMLRAEGMSRQTILGHYVGFGVIAAAIGAVPGAIVAVPLAGALAKVYTEQLSIPITISQFFPLTPVMGIAFGLLTGVIAALAPARRAAAVAPAEAMRRQAPPVGGGPSLFERLIPPLGHASARRKLSLRGIGRNKRRTLSTLLGVVLALVLILVSWGMVDTMTILVNRQYTEIEKQDATLTFATAANTSQLNRIRDTDGVSRVEPAIQTPVSVRGPDGRYQTVLTAFERETRMHTFLSSSGGQLELQRDGLLGGEALKGDIGAEQGAELAIGVPSNDETVKATLNGFVSEPIGTFVYASIDAVKRASRRAVTSGNTALVSYDGGVDRERMRRVLSRVPSVVAFQDSNQLLESMNNYLGLFYAFVGVMLLLGGAMAFALLFAAMSSSISERTVEIATLRASGLSHGEIARMITLENVIIVSLGIVPGLVLGLLGSAAFLGSFSSDQFTLTLQIRPTTLILSALVIFITALISQIPGLRAIRRLSVAQVVRERAA